jgi:hypothetical protein
MAREEQSSLQIPRHTLVIFDDQDVHQVWLEGYLAASPQDAEWPFEARLSRRAVTLWA